MRPPWNGKQATFLNPTYMCIIFLVKWYYPSPTLPKLRRVGCFRIYKELSELDIKQCNSRCWGDCCMAFIKTQFLSFDSNLGVVFCLDFDRRIVIKHFDKTDPDIFVVVPGICRRTAELISPFSSVAA